MNSNDKRNVFNRVDELKDLFQFGQKVLGFFDGLFQLYKEVLPMLQEINQSIEDSSNKLPKASSGLSQVSQATEVATIEILDTLEILSGDVEDSEKKLIEHIERNKKRAAAEEKLMKTLKTLEKSDYPDEKSRLIKLVEESSQHKQDRLLLEHLMEKFKRISQYTSNITISLQVQDITSQQLAAVTHLVESVHDRLNTLLTNFNGEEISKLNEVFNPSKGAFDPNASYDRSGVRQGLADSLHAQHVMKSRSETPSPDREKKRDEHGLQDRINKAATQEEIDKMFGR